MLEGINIISTEVTKDVTIPNFYCFLCDCLCFDVFVNPNSKNWF